MLSAVIEVGDGDEERLARTLASLVPAAVEGILREVIVIVPEGAAAAAAVAEHAGCRLAAALGEAVGGAKGAWLLFLEPGARPVGGWLEPVGRHIAEGAGPARFALEAAGLRCVLLCWGLARRHPLARGLLVARREAVALAPSAASGSELARRLKPRSLTARIMPAGLPT